MKIINQYGEIKVSEKYAMTKGQMISVKDVEDGELLKVEKYLIFVDEDKKTGNDVEILSIMGTTAIGEKVIWATQSETFKRSFLDISDIYDDAVSDGEEVDFIIKKLSGTTKSNRPYVNCIFAI